jgi:hypothetical protein
VPEVEPNDGPDQAQALATETWACGVFDDENDADFWTFTLPEDGWLAVDAPGASLGSDAYVSVTLASDDLDVAFGIASSGELPEVHVVFPSTRSTWVATVRQTVGFGAVRGGGPDFFYELRASSTKAPIDWDVEEGSNDAQGAAQRLVTATDADVTTRVLGDLDDAADQDWYEVEVPGPGWAVTFDVDAAAEGSAADVALQVIDEAGASHGIKKDVDEVSPDPFFTRLSTAAGVMRVRVSEESGASGPPTWYRLTVTAEAP